MHYYDFSKFDNIAGPPHGKDSIPDRFRIHLVRTAAAANGNIVEKTAGLLEVYPDGAVFQPTALAIGPVIVQKRFQAIWEDDRFSFHENGWNIFTIQDGIKPLDE